MRFSRSNIESAKFGRLHSRAKKGLPDIVGSVEGEIDDVLAYEGLVIFR